MKKQKIMKVGNSVCVTVPAHFVKALGVMVGEEVEVKTIPEKGKVIYHFSGSQQLTFTEKLLGKGKKRKRK